MMRLDKESSRNMPWRYVTTPIVLLVASICRFIFISDYVQDCAHATSSSWHLI